MYRSKRTHSSVRGFTLLEIMLVLLLIGIAAGYVMYNAFGVSQSDLLKNQAKRLQVIVTMASDFAVLNQQQLGIRFEQKDASYYFVQLDEENEWQRISGEKIFEPHELPEQFTFELNIDDLPWEVEDRLFDRDLFDESLSVSEDGVEIGNEEEKKLPPPQILIMSSGEVTPFSLNFVFEGDVQEFPVYFALINKDAPPLELLGPLEDLYSGE
ncbi:type II secretion system minor pseudopilin GspH [Alteromonas sp. KUL49]|uniref:type II secretion system minor pseudopilin GspH n=1 Tax=Alteromonas sp. KUL49 TaxID=2480798 RepID=UPI00102F1E4E|nr:type II secretion system minor pseudopilin GspH [Alteromonas sp. KUL49]TAP42203.1 type II secretion system protein GspH [Alteromonas sp. KUL49]